MQIQKQEGIDAVIVDAVLEVRKGLTAPTEDGTPANGTAPNGNAPNGNATTSVDAAAASNGVDGAEDGIQAAPTVPV